MKEFYSALSFLVMLAHFTLVLFNIFGFFLVWKHPRLKPVHLGSLVITSALMIAGQVCPLTTLEQKLKAAADPSATYEEGFLSHYLGKLLYVNLPPWTLAAATTLLALAALWFYYLRPRTRK